MAYLTSGIIEKFNGYEKQIPFSTFNAFPTLLSFFKNIDENPKVKEWNIKN